MPNDERNIDLDPIDFRGKNVKKNKKKINGFLLLMYRTIRFISHKKLALFQQKVIFVHSNFGSREF